MKGQVPKEQSKEMGGEIEDVDTLQTLLEYLIFVEKENKKGKYLTSHFSSFFFFFF